MSTTNQTQPEGTTQTVAAARSGILALLDEFNSRIDSGESVADLFIETAVFMTPRGATRGRDAIAGLFASMHISRAAQGYRARHAHLSVRVRAGAGNRREVSSILTAISLPASYARSGSLLVADQLDIVEQDASGAWRFAERTLHPALEFALDSKTEARS